jgi:hypothetical protein
MELQMSDVKSWQTRSAKERQSRPYFALVIYMVSHPLLLSESTLRGRNSSSHLYLTQRLVGRITCLGTTRKRRCASIQPLSSLIDKTRECKGTEAESGNENDAHDNSENSPLFSKVSVSQIASSVAIMNEISKTISFLRPVIVDIDPTSM